MPSMLEASKIDALYSLFTGTPGVRKSTQALSYPLPQYWFSYDKKMKALTKPMRDWGIDPKQVSYDDYDNWDMAASKLNSFLLQCPYKTIVIDSITSLADSALRQVRLSKGKDVKSVGGISVNSIEDYNAESSALTEMIALTKNLHQIHKVNIILIAHLIQAEYKSNPNAPANVVRTIVTAGKKVAPKIPAYADESYYFYLKGGMAASDMGEYGILTQSTTEDFARTILPLNREISFGDKPLYSTFIKPAIDKINSFNL